MILYLRDDLARVWPENAVFDIVKTVQGEVYRDKENRRTLRFELGGKGYFLKLHQGVGWREILKNLVQLRWPILGAKNEWQAIETCHKNGISTLSMAGYGSRGLNPARQQSFLVTDELTGVISLEDYCRHWATQPPDYSVKRALVERIAGISRRFHRAGMNHRDFYICHFLLAGDANADAACIRQMSIYLIDLHRTQMRKNVPTRWLVKDLGALYFSVLDCGLSRRDIVRFIRAYTRGPAVKSIRKNPQFWRAVRRRAVVTYQRDFGRLPELPL